jgi:choline-glycine betaine transporter
MDNIEKLKAVWVFYFTLTALSGLGLAISMLGIIVGWVTGEAVIILLLPFVVCTLACTFSMYKWLGIEKELSEALKHEPRKRSKKT